MLVAVSPASAAPTCAGHRATKIGTRFADTIIGTPGRDVIVALGGHDRIDARGGNDIVCGGRGNDTIFGGSGRDRLLGERGADEFRDGPGNDVVRTGPAEVDLGVLDDLGSIFLARRASVADRARVAMRAAEDRENDVVHAQPGNDRISGRGWELSFKLSKRAARVNLATGRVRGAGKDRITGARFVTGSKRADRVLGSSRGEVLVGGRGVDVLRSGGGDDFLEPGRGADVVDAGPGSDFGFYQGDQVRLGTGDDLAVLVSSTVYGEAGMDAFVPFGPAVVDGGADADYLGLETFDGSGVTADMTTGLADIGATVHFALIEIIEGGEGPDVLTGDDNANTLSGGDGDDQLLGLGGDDSLDGGDGTDTADGGDGTDTCVAETPTACE